MAAIAGYTIVLEINDNYVLALKGTVVLGMTCSVRHYSTPWLLLILWVISIYTHIDRVAVYRMLIQFRSCVVEYFISIPSVLFH